MNFLKPLLRGTRFSMGDDVSCWVRFSYERLSSFYYLCVCLGHGDKEYGLRKHAAQVDMEESLPYGAWLRASSYGNQFCDGRS